VQNVKVRVDSGFAERRAWKFTDLFTKLLKSAPAGTLHIEKVCERLWKPLPVGLEIWVKARLTVRYNPLNTHADRYIQRNNTAHMPKKLKARPAAAAVAGKNGHSLITNEKFRQLYTALLKHELLEERLGLSADGADGAASGLIAGAVGITLDLEREDTVVLGPQTFAANLIKGIPANALLNHRESGGKSTPLMYGRVNAFTPGGVTSAVTQAGLATGAALANKMARNGKVAVAFMEGGVAALAECREALELASSHRLPAIYVILAGPGIKLEKALAEMSGMFPVITVDAHDAVAVYRVAQESIARARSGDPSLIVCVPYLPNSTQASALTNMEQYLTRKKLFRNRWKDQAIAELDREITAACLPPVNPLA
jgi:hypothetical protein